MKAIALFVAVVFVFLGTGAAYGMGGGGSHGDGRWDFRQDSGTNSGSATYSQAQDTGRAWTGTSGNTDACGGRTDPLDDPVTLPEPITLLLLGSGLAGLAGLRRKFRK